MLCNVVHIAGGQEQHTAQSKPIYRSPTGQILRKLSLYTHFIVKSDKNVILIANTKEIVTLDTCYSQI